MVRFIGNYTCLIYDGTMLCFPIHHVPKWGQKGIRATDSSFSSQLSGISYIWAVFRKLAQGMFWHVVSVFLNTGIWFHQHCPIRSPSIFALAPRKLNMRFKKFRFGWCSLIRRRCGPRKVEMRLEKCRFGQHWLIRRRSCAPWTDLAPECFRFPPLKWTRGLTNNRMQPGLW